ncbi:2-keto-3-deoxygluconate permease [Frigoribacterium sp. CFBP 8754]|uniref:2-keto-3-deoxygluconate permease n=1 Tax=Frigoribacterium sp. CFBP 8754 TaxID=2775290 RepID=UPI001785DF35|nr:2-keto-3-deoxygluconate permease [Frigoribacterium sp. CFBP 8754]MBD8660609.1 2-keto-3-deoxygluconate permease [Frigoribacterium sp. CFBP 8754]
MAVGPQITSRVPLFDGMNKIPGGLMLIPLIIGSIVGTFAPGFLDLGNFTTALFRDSALPLIGVLIFATGMQITLRTSGPVLATSGVLLLTKSIIPATLVVVLGTVVGIEGILGVSILALLVSMDNSNGGIWLAFTGRYGRERDRGAYIASAVNDGPFFSLLFLGAAGLADIPYTLLLAAVIPLLLGIVVGNLDPRWTEVMRPVPNIVIPFFAFALGTGIDLGNVVTGGLSGIVVGVIAVLLTGTTTYLGFRLLLRRGKESGIGIASATTAGNAIATPAIVGAADPSFAPYVEVATAQVASAVLVSAVLAPLLAAWVLKRQGGDRSHEIAAEADAEAVLAHDAAAAAAAPDRDLDPGRGDSPGRRRPTDGGAA